MKYKRNVLGQCDFAVDGVTGTATLVESRGGRVTQRVEIVIADSGKAYSIPVEFSKQRGLWAEERAVRVPRPPEELLLFSPEEIGPPPRRRGYDPTVEALFGKLTDPPPPRPRREHAGGVQRLVLQSEGGDCRATGTVDFDYDAVDAQLGFDDRPEIRQRAVAYGGNVVLELLNWVQADLDKGYDVNMPATERNMYIRVQVLRYYLDRETMGAPSLEQLKRRLCVSKETLRFLLNDLEARYGLVSPLRKPDRARRAMSAAPRSQFFKA